MGGPDARIQDGHVPAVPRVARPPGHTGPNQACKNARRIRRRAARFGGRHNRLGQGGRHVRLNGNNIGKGLQAGQTLRRNPHGHGRYELKATLHAGLGRIKRTQDRIAGGVDACGQGRIRLKGLRPSLGRQAFLRRDGLVAPGGVLQLVKVSCRKKDNDICAP